MIPGVPNKLLLALAERPSVQEFLTRRHLTRAVVDRFVAGDRLEDAITAARQLGVEGIRAILDYLGENVTLEAQAGTAADAYLESLNALARADLDAHISVKLTQLGLSLSFDRSLERMEKICARAAEVGTFVAIDMESHAHTERTIETYRRLRASHDNVVLCLQAYLKRTAADVESLLPLAPAIRLCKGAYDEPREIAFGPRATRASFRKLLATLLESCPYTAVATHDESLIDEAKRLAELRKIPPERYEFQLLYGVRRDLQTQLVADGYRVRIYVPFGDQWYPYLIRRLAERPANLRFFLAALLRG